MILSWCFDNQLNFKPHKCERLLANFGLPERQTRVKKFQEQLMISLFASADRYVWFKRTFTIPTSASLAFKTFRPLVALYVCLLKGDVALSQVTR